jgi:hypothetical protein
MNNIHPIKYIYIGFSCIILFFLPNIILGESAKISFVDNLDSNLVWIKILISNNLIFANPGKNINIILNGVPRSSIYSFYDLSFIWFKFFGMYWGYLINKIIMSFVGFTGVYLLQIKYFKKYYLNNFITITISLIYALQPFWSFNLTIAGLPLLLFVFLELHNNSKNNFIWLYIIIFPFYSSLFLSGIFIIFSLLFFYFFYTYSSNSINKKYSFSIILITLLYLISHFPVFYTFLNSNYVSHRQDFVTPIYGFTDAVLLTIKLFFFGQFHSGGAHFFYLPILLISLYFQIKLNIFNKLFKFILFFIVISSIYYGFIHSFFLHNISYLIFKVFPIQTERFYFLHPLAWILLLIIGSSYFRNKISILKLILIINIIFVISKNEMFSNTTSIPFNKYYAVSQFNDIKKFINTPVDKYKVINVGIEPAVSQFNGLYTLDGYLPDYPLSHKNTFRKVIVKELERSKTIKNYYDNWGSRCYSFSSELDLKKIYSKGNNIIIENLFFDYKLLKNMGCNYVISSVKINQEKNNNLVFQGKFVSAYSQWDIYLYKII